MLAKALSIDNFWKREIPSFAFTDEQKKQMEANKGYIYSDVTKQPS